MKRAILLTTSSRPGHFVCPACEYGELQPQAHGLAASCAVCDCLFSGVVLNVLAQIAALPEAPGQTRLRGVSSPRDAFVARGGVPLPGLRL